MADKVFSGVMKILLFIGSVLGSFIAVTLAINTLVYTPLNTAIAAERKDREDAVCEEAKIRCNEDKIGLENLDKKLDTIISQNITIGNTLASYTRQVDINTRRIDKLEETHNAKTRGN